MIPLGDLMVGRATGHTADGHPAAPQPDAAQCTVLQRRVSSAAAPPRQPHAPQRPAARIPLNSFIKSMHQPGSRSFGKSTAHAHMSQPAVSGRGELKLPNGALYVGDWLNHKPHGKGKMVQDPISKKLFSYEGDWREGKQHGLGVFKYADGSFYEGYWRNHKQHGKGVFKYATDGRTPLPGLEYSWNAGDQYDGEYKADVRHGACTYTFFNGETLNCTWVDGRCPEFTARQAALRAAFSGGIKRIVVKEEETTSFAIEFFTLSLCLCFGLVAVAIRGIELTSGYEVSILLSLASCIYDTTCKRLVANRGIELTSGYEICDLLSLASCIYDTTCKLVSTFWSFSKIVFIFLQHLVERLLNDVIKLLHNTIANAAKHAWTKVLQPTCRVVKKMLNGVRFMGRKAAAAFKMIPSVIGRAWNMCWTKVLELTGRVVKKMAFNPYSQAPALNCPFSPATRLLPP